MVRKSATARMEEEFRESREEANPAENDAMYEAEAQYGVSFENVDDYKKWKELQGLNSQIMANSTQAPTSSPSAETVNVDAPSRDPRTLADFGSRQPQIPPRQVSQVAHSSASVSTAPTPAVAHNSATSTTNATPNFGRGQPQSADQASAGASSGCTPRNAASPSERMSVSAQIPEVKTRFLIGTGGRTIQHLQRTWSGIEMNLRTKSVPHTLSIHGERTDLERFLLHVGSFLDENLMRETFVTAQDTLKYARPPRPTTALPSLAPSSSQAMVHPRQESHLTIHRHYAVPPGVTGRLIGSYKSRQKQIEKDHSVRIGWFEDGAKCRISASTEAAIQNAVSAMNRIIRPAELSETSTTQAATSKVQHVSETGPTASTNRENMNLPPCNRSDFGGFRRGLSVANLGRLYPPPTNVPPATLTTEEEELQVTAEDGLLSAAVEIEKLELQMKSILPVQHSIEALHANALLKAYMAAFLYVADNIFRQSRPAANTIRVFSIPANWTFAEIHQLLEGYDVVDVVRKRHGVRDYTLSSKGFVTFRSITEAVRADEDDQKWSDAGITVEKLRVKECA